MMGSLTNLTISHTDESLIDQLVPLWISGLSLHDVTLCFLISQGDGRNLLANQKCFEFHTQ